MKAILLTLLTAVAALAGASFRSAQRTQAPAGCPAALEFFRRYTAVELLPDQFALFASAAVIRLYGETADGQDLGHKDLTVDEYRAFSSDTERMRGLGRVPRFSRIRCELDGPNWHVTAQRHASHKHYAAPVSLLIGHQNGQMRVLSAAYVQVAD